MPQSQYAFNAGFIKTELTTSTKKSAEKNIINKALHDQSDTRDDFCCNKYDEPHV